MVPRAALGSRVGGQPSSRSTREGEAPPTPGGGAAEEGSPAARTLEPWPQRRRRGGPVVTEDGAVRECKPKQRLAPATAAEYCNHAGDARKWPKAPESGTAAAFGTPAD